MRLLRFSFLLALLLLCGQRALAQDLEALLEQFNAAYEAATAADEAKDLQKALPEWQKAFEAIDQFEESEDIVPFKEAVLFKLGETHRLLAKESTDPALREEHEQQAAQAFTALLERAVLAVYERDDVLLQLGYLESSRGKLLETQGHFEQALQAQEKAIEHFSAVADAARREDALARERSAMARTLKNLGRYPEALQALGFALEHWTASGNIDELRREKNALATVKLNMGRIAEAAKDLTELLAAAPEAKDLTQASAAFNLAICQQLLGEYQRSQANLDKALALARELSAQGDGQAGQDEQELARQIVNSQGILSYYLGLYQDALARFADAARSQDSQLRAKALLNAVAVQIAALQESFDHQVFVQAEQDAVESMALAQTMGDPRTTLAATQNMGRLQFELASAPDAAEGPEGGKIDKQLRVQAYAKSLEHLGRALSGAEELRSNGAAMYEYSDIASNIGDVLLQLAGAGLNGEVNTSGLCPDAPLLQCSLSQYRLALDNAARIQAMEQLWQAHLGLGRANRALGNADAAAEHFRQAIEIIESMRGVLGGAEAAGFLRNRGEAYTEYLDLLLEQWAAEPPDSAAAQEHARTALVYLERSRLAALKGLFEQALPKERQEQGRELAEVEYRLTRLRLAGEAEKEELAALEADKARLEQALQEGDPLLAKPSLDLDAVQKILPPEVAALIWYYNDTDIFVWKLDSESLVLRKTPRKIGAGRRARDLVTDFVPLFGERIAGGDVTGLLADFYRKLFLDTKLELDPEKYSRLAVVPFGGLAALPFGAFIEDKDSGRYLLRDFQVQYLFALGQLSLLARDKTQEGGSFLAVGNPDLPAYFGKEVPLVEPESGEQTRSGGKGEAGRQAPGLVPDLTVLPYEEAAFIYRMLNPEDYAPTVQPVETSRAFGFNPLPDAGEEARVVGGDFEQRGLGQSVVSTDTSVGESALLEQMRAEPRGYVHLATHGKLLPKSPLDSFLVFSEDPEAPEGYKSGLVTVRQIRGELFGKLKEARLCTLSCCETALRGQGLGLELASLAGAFQSAGASVVVASLWEVPSKATSLLMQSFYQHLFDGMPVAEALGRAQMELASGEEFAAPVNWAAFIAIGVDPHEAGARESGQNASLEDTNGARDARKAEES